MEKAKERTCPWCGETAVPEVKHRINAYGEVVERTCSKCGKVLAAYLEEEGDFLTKIRSY